MIIGFIIHLTITFAWINDPEYSGAGYFFLIFVVGNVIGMLCIVANQVILGARVFLISSIIFIPIGLIGALGARDIVNDIKKDNFINKQKKEQNESI